MSRKMNKSNAKGFTLIEVVLVLAIGGLIFLLAFLAFQNASKNRRDTQRRSDAGKVLAEISNAESDGYSITPLKIRNQEFKNKYLGGSDFKGPGNPGATYITVAKTSGTAVPSTEDRRNIFIGLEQSCEGADNTKRTIGSNAVIVVLEKGTACRDSE